LNFLKESYRVLKKGGKLIITTDNAGFFGIFGRVHHGDYEEVRENEGINQDRHYALFTPNHLENWLRYVGFRKIKVGYYICERHILKKHIPLIKLLTVLSKRFLSAYKSRSN
jgi:tRNA G46 methylase TrmB